MTDYFEKVIRTNEGDLSTMHYFVTSLVKMMSTIPGIAIWFTKNQSYLAKIYDWVTDHPNPRKDKYYDFTYQASQAFNLTQLKKLKEGQPITETDAWDSDEEMLNYKFSEGEILDYNYD